MARNRKLNTNSMVDPRNAHSDSYNQTMKEIVADGGCPLCPPMKWHPNPILKDDGRWFITRNSHPYEGAKHHFLIIRKKHITTLDKLTLNDMRSILGLSKWTTKEFDIKGGGLAMRFGDTLYTGATIKHLHAHLIVPKVRDGKVTPVYFPFG